MRAGAAKKKAADRRFVPRPIENGAHGEKLIERELAMKNVAACETVGCFEILGSDDLNPFDEAGKIGHVRGESIDDGVGEILAAGVPVPFFQLEWRELNAGGEDVLAVRGERGIENRRNGDVEIRSFRKFAVFGGVKGALEVIDFGADVDAAGEGFEINFAFGKSGKSRQTPESEIDLGDGAIGTEIFDAVGKGGIELRRIEEMEEGALGIDAGDDGLDGDFFAAGQNDAGDSAVFDEDVADFGIRTNFSAGQFCGFGGPAREGAETSPGNRAGADGMGIGGGA